LKAGCSSTDPQDTSLRGKGGNFRKDQTKECLKVFNLTDKKKRPIFNLKRTNRQWGFERKKAAVLTSREMYRGIPGGEQKNRGRKGGERAVYKDFKKEQEPIRNRKKKGRKRNGEHSPYSKREKGRQNPEN